MTDTEPQVDSRWYPGHWAAERPDHPAVVMTGSGETMTYAELDAYANRLSQWLRAAGIQPGDHVAFCLENRLEFLAVLWGCHYAGTYYTAISTRLTSSEMAHVVNNCGARAFVASPYVGGVAAELVGLTPDVEVRLSIGGPVSHHEPVEIALRDVPADPLPDRAEAADMLYSSGTTGLPKGVKHPAPRGDLGTGESVMQLGQLLFGFTPDAVYLSPGPLYHAAPLRFCRSILRTGGTVIVLERFDAEDALAAIERHRVTVSQWVPTMFIRMLKLPDEARSRYDLSSHDCAVHAAAPCPVEVKHRMIDWWGPIVHEYYAGTEGNGFTYVNSEDWLTHEGTVGKAIIGQIRIVDDDGTELPVGEVGGVYFSEGNEFEYHLDPDKTADSYLESGWSTLGDIGRVDEDGFLYLTDRKSFMIISGGVNIYPQEVENALALHPDVVDVAVIGVPDDDLGEAVKAIVQPTTMPATEVESRRLESRLMAFCRERLAGVKCPRSFDFREDLPRHPTGKLYKRLLRDEYWSTDQEAP